MKSSIVLVLCLGVFMGAALAGDFIKSITFKTYISSDYFIFPL